MGIDNADKKVYRTSPRDKGHLNLRIKSSKAFPPNEVAVIESMINRVKDAQEERERKFRIANPSDFSKIDAIMNRGLEKKKAPKPTSGAIAGITKATPPVNSYKYLKLQMGNARKEVEQAQYSQRNSEKYHLQDRLRNEEDMLQSLSYV